MPAIAVTSQQSLKTSSLLLTELTEQCRSSLSWGCRVYATRRDLFIPAIVDPRPSRTIHCPDLNACLVNESRLKHNRVDCQTIHFGYAIPINIIPVHESPELVELILDQSAEFSIQAINFLLNHHPQLRKQQHFYEMATTAKHDLRRKFPADTTPSGEEDIAAIAKQISDHAEAIYQTWKSRGLAPTEILTCHSNETAVDKFGSALTPCTLPTIGNNVTSSKALPSPSIKHSSPTADDILTQTPNLDNGNLEKLVNNFVVEDKARIAASKQKSSLKPLPSSIQFALQKFEKNSMQQQQTAVSTRSNINPIDNSKKLTSVLLASPSSNKPSQIVKPQIFTKTLGSRHCEVFLETIETTFPVDLTSSKKVTQKRPASILIASSPTSSSLNINSTHSTNSGLTTWPLKNKLNDARRIIDVSHTSTKTSQQEEIAKILPTKDEKRSIVIETNSCVYIDEVAREEERLINALKTGAVITEESERTMTSERKKPAIKQEKPKIEFVKPIIIGSHHEVNLMVSSSAMSNSVTSGSTTAANIGNATAVVSTNHNPLINESKSYNKDDLSALSLVDYAKIRYKAAQQNPPTQQRLEEQRASSHPYHSTTEQLVSSTRTKFEMEIQKDKEVKDSDKDNLIATRWGPRISSPRPRLEQTVPHPELTNQQKQHIRAAAATGTGNNPVRPFLTRGSVAERVLIFEKCPSELLLDKRGPRQPAINTWRSGHEVQNKAQVFFYFTFPSSNRDVLFFMLQYDISRRILCLIRKQSLHNPKFSYS